ncbi:MAG: hypothetical protein GXO26_01455 [Crenarchaeota archaeon]|nr:hypothetical protein [Thermoproteota archaeon]
MFKFLIGVLVFAFLAGALALIFWIFSWEYYYTHHVAGIVSNLYAFARGEKHYVPPNSRVLVSPGSQIGQVSVSIEEGVFSGDGKYAEIVVEPGTCVAYAGKSIKYSDMVCGPKIIVVEAGYYYFTSIPQPISNTIQEKLGWLALFFATVIFIGLAIYLAHVLRR